MAAALPLYRVICFLLPFALALAGLEARRGARLWHRFGAILFRHGGAFYNFEGLRAFKNKFAPEWRPRFIAVPPGMTPLAALRDAALLIAGSARRIVGK